MLIYVLKPRLGLLVGWGHKWWRRHGSFWRLRVKTGPIFLKFNPPVLNRWFFACRKLKSQQARYQKISALSPTYRKLLKCLTGSQKYIFWKHVKAVVRVLSCFWVVVVHDFKIHKKSNFTGSSISNVVTPITYVEIRY